MTGETIIFAALLVLAACSWTAVIVELAGALS